VVLEEVDNRLRLDHLDHGDEHNRRCAHHHDQDGPAEGDCPLPRVPLSAGSAKSTRVRQQLRQLDAAHTDDARPLHKGGPCRAEHTIQLRGHEDVHVHARLSRWVGDGKTAVGDAGSAERCSRGERGRRRVCRAAKCEPRLDRPRGRVEPEESLRIATSLEGDA